MDPISYAASPWNYTAPSYENSFLHMRPAPEFASGEVLLASLYRNVGFSGVSEGKVPSEGRKFEKRISPQNKKGPHDDTVSLDRDIFYKIISRSLNSPKQPNQSGKRFLQICPIVPDAALYSLSARLASNSWNPGSLIARMLCYGVKDKNSKLEVWKRLFDSLSVTGDDDIWARVLQQEFESRRDPASQIAWQSPITLDPKIDESHLADLGIVSPACQFSEDLNSVMSIKNLLTRRQWISMLESLLRVGSAAHILWLCRANSECLTIFVNALDSNDEITPEQVSSRLSSASGGFWRIGQPATTTVKEYARDFLYGRAGINLIFLHCAEVGLLENLSIRNPEEIAKFANYLSKNKSIFPQDIFNNNLQEIIENDSGVFACKKGISSNIVEFITHVLRQRQTSESGMESYDQGYFLRKKSSYKSSPWIVGLGPVAIMSLVHACTSASKGPRTVDDLCGHIARYGFTINAQDVSESDLGKSLRNLGLVIDSPDAEGGMVLDSPFSKSTLTGASRNA